MRFNPKSQKDIATMNLLGPGSYMFEVIKAEDAISKKGHPMIKLNIKIFDDFKRNHSMLDWLVFIENNSLCERKIRNFCESTSMLDVYNSGELLDIHCIGKTGWCKIGLEEDLKGIMRNIIVDYIKESSSIHESNNPTTAPKEPIFDDDIPF